MRAALSRRVRVNTLTSVLALALAAYAGVAALMYFQQRQMIYLPSTYLETTPDQHGFEYEDVTIESTNGNRIHGWFIPAPARAGTVLFLHGNAGNVSHRMESIAILRTLGLDVLIIDYQGYGNSEGAPSEAATYDDAAAAWEHLVGERGLDPARVIVFGRSLGGAVAAWLVQRERPAGLILESTFSSLGTLGSHHYPWLPVRWLLRYEYDTLSRMSRIQVPVLVIHSPDDDLVPYHHAELLLEAANPPKRLVTIAGDHNTGFLGDPARYTAELARFANEVLP